MGPAGEHLVSEDFSDGEDAIARASLNDSAIRQQEGHVPGASGVGVLEHNWPADHSPLLGDVERGTHPPVLRTVALDIPAQDAIRETLTEPDDPAAAVISIDPANGAIRAMTAVVPGRRNNQFNLLSQARRQPGSTFKPVVYGYALSARKITPATLFDAAPGGGRNVASQITASSTTPPATLVGSPPPRRAR